jgi:segregation and condensation protein B
MPKKPVRVPASRSRSRSSRPSRVRSSPGPASSTDTPLPPPTPPASGPVDQALPAEPEATSPAPAPDLPTPLPASSPSVEVPSGPAEAAEAGSREDAEGEGDEENESTAPAATPRPRGVDPELSLRVEALLFGAGKPLDTHELVARLGGDVDHVLVRRALKKLMRAYGSRQTSLEVRRAGDAWALQVRETYLPVAHRVTPTDIPAHTLRVLALIAFHQPIRQSLLARMVGEAAYSEVKVLRDLEFIHAAPKASTLELTTSTRFAQYFGLESTDKDRIRETLAKKLGIDPRSLGPPPPPEDGAGSSEPAPPPDDPGKGAPLPAE